MNRSFNIFLWVIFFMLMAPSGMVLASWNAVPGDATYSWKTGMENILIAVLPSQQLKSATHSKLTERRMGEVSKVLSGSHASEGLANLNKQMFTTQASLKEIKNPEERAKAVAAYIQTLNEVSSQLENEKQSRAVSYLPPNQATADDYSLQNLRQQRTTRPTAIPTNNNAYNPPANNNQPTYAPTTNPTYRPTTNPTYAPTTNPTALPATQPPVVPNPEDEEEVIGEEIVEEIGDTQDEIDDIIEDLEEVLEEAASQDPAQAPVQAPVMEANEAAAGQAEQTREAGQVQETQQQQQRREEDQRQREEEHQRDEEERNQRQEEEHQQRENKQVEQEEESH